MKKFLIILLLGIMSVPAMAQTPTEYQIDEVFRKLYPKPEWYIKLTTADNNWTFCYDILTDEIVPGKVYTIDDMLKSDCQAYDNWERVSHKFETATYCETYAPDGKLMIEATATTADGMNILLHYGIDPLPVAKDTIDVVTSDVELNDLTSRDAAMFVGTTEDYVVSVGIKCDHIPGEYTTDNLYLSFCYIEPTGGELTEVLDGHATIVATERGYNLEAYLLGEDEHCYHAVFTYELPEPLETRILKCDNLVVNTTYVSQFGEIIYEASNEDWELELWVNSDKPFGYFSGNVVDASYSVLTNRHTKEMMDLYYADFVVSTDDKSVFLKGGMMARDKNYYVLDLSCPLTVDTRSETLEINDANFFDNTAKGILQLYGKTPDGNKYVALALKTTEISTATYDRSQTYRDYTYIEEYAPNHVFYEPYLATINLMPHEDGSINIEAYLRCDNLVDEEDHPLFVVRMHCTSDDVQLGLRFDAQNQDFDGSIPSDRLQIDDTTLDEGYVFLDGYDPQSRCSVSLVFNITALDPEIGIPAGTYPINDSWENGTVSASRGVQDNVVGPSYAAYGDENGSLDVPVWLLQSGNVVVTNKEGQLLAEVNALNSCNRKVHITLGGTPSGIDQLSSAIEPMPAKMLRSGQFYIKHGHRIYDAAGRQWQATK